METFCFPAFKRAAAAVATFELRVRLLADSGADGTPLQKAAIGMDLTRLIEMVCKEYGVTGRVRPLAEQLNEGGTWMGNVTDGSVEQVSKTKTQTGRIYGWM